MEFDINDWMPYIHQIGIAILIFVVGWILSKWASRLTHKLSSKYDPALSSFLSGIAQYVVLAMTVIASLSAVGVQTTSLVAVLASAGLAVGLALQGNLSNFASGAMILIFRPFGLEDRVTLGGSHTGIVKDIGIFTTTLSAPAETIIVPNSKITGEAVINHTVDGKCRAIIDVGVAYGSNINQVAEILIAAAASCPLVLKDPGTAAAFVNLGASSLDFKVHAFSTPENFVQVKHDVRKACYDALNEAGIEIPFAQLVVHKAEA